MKRTILVVLSATLTLNLTGCGTIVPTKCGKFEPNVVMTKYAKIKKIAIEEANNNGFDKLTTEIKPSKYNDFEGKLIFQMKTQAGTDSLYIEMNHDTICFRGGGTVARPDTAIAAMLERYTPDMK